MLDTTAFGSRELLEWLVGCESRDEMQKAIRAWLHSHPRPRSTEEILAHVDNLLAGWYQPPDGYDPRIVGPVLDKLAEIPARILRESGSPGAEDFDARRWTHDWAHESHPAFGGRPPVHGLHTQEGAALARSILEQLQSGAYL